MRLRITPTSLLVAVFLGLSGLLWGAETIWLKKDDNGRIISVNRQSLIQVELEEAGSTGYQWIIDDMETAGCLDLVGTTVKHSGIRSILGAPSVRVWILKATGAGASHLRIHYRRPWEMKDKASETFQVRVNCS